MQWECHNCGEMHSELPDRCRRCGTAPEVVLNVWRCQHCGQEEIPGTAGSCPTCGAAQLLGGDSRVDAGSRVEGSRGLALARGQWLYCAFCDVQVPPVNEAGAPNEACPNCSGPLTEAEKEAAEQTLSADEAGSYRKVAVQGVGGAGKGPAVPVRPAPKKGPPPPRRRKGCLVLGLAAAALALGFYLLFIHTWERNLTVAARSWERAVQVEKFGPVQGEAWLSSLPSGAYDRSCQRKIHHHDKVPDGTETYTDRESTGRRCTGYKYKSKGGVSVKQCAHWETTYRTVRKTRTRYRSVPVYAQFCRYTEDRWSTSHQLKVSGGDSDSPRWPDTSALDGKKTRAGARTESYTLVLKKEDQTTERYKCQNQGEWDRFKMGMPVVCEVTGAGVIQAVRPAGK